MEYSTTRTNRDTDSMRGRWGEAPQRPRTFTNARVFRHSTVLVWTLLLLSSAVLRGYAQAAVRAGNDLVIELRGVQGQIERGQLRRAEQRLRELLAGLGPDAPASSGYPRLTKMLAEVYFYSGQYTDALEWAMRCQQYLNAAGFKEGAGTVAGTARRVLRTTVPDPFLYHRKQEAVLLLARINGALNDSAAAVQSATQALDLHEPRRFANPAEELHMLASIARVLASAGDRAKLAEVRPKVTTLADWIADRYRENRASLQDYRQGVVTYVDYVADAYPPGEARRRLLDYADRIPDTRVEIWSTIAKLHRTENEYVEERQALIKARRLADEERQNEQAGESSHVLLLADFDRRIAQALRDIGQTSSQLDISVNHPAEYSIRARKLYLDSLTQIESQPENSRSVTQDLAIRQALQVVTYYLYIDGEQISGKAETITASQIINVSQNLLHRLTHTVLDRDRRIFDVKLLMGSVYLNERDIDKALSHLSEVRDYWSNQTPRDHRSLVQALTLLAEAKRQRQQSDEEQSLLKGALNIVQRDLPDDSRLTIGLKLKLGRSLARDEKHSEARALFEESRELAHQVNDTRNQLLCDAELSDLHVVRRDLAALADTLDAANEILEQASFPRDDSLTLQFLHQKAMFHYLRDETEQESGNTEDRNEARRIWRRILKVQEERDFPPAQRARTLHYLARLRFRDWSETMKKVRRKRKSTLLDQIATYDERRGDYNDRLSEYGTRYEDYQEELAQFRGALLGYRKQRKLNAQPAATEVGLAEDRARLLSNRERLLQIKKQLDIERDSLRALAPRLEKEFKSTSTAASEFRGRSREQLLQMLTESESLASRAGELLEKAVDVDAKLSERIRSSHEQIIKSARTLNQEYQ